MSDVVMALSRLGRHEEALELAEKAVSMHKTASGTNSLSTAQALCGLGAALLAQERHKEAAVPLQQRLDIHTEMLGEDHTVTAWSRIDVAVNLMELNSSEDDPGAIVGMLERSAIILKESQDTIQLPAEFIEHDLLNI
jgi:tetratricopeptide (TPR) repeat protein